MSANIPTYELLEKVREILKIEHINRDVSMIKSNINNVDPAQ